MGYTPSYSPIFFNRRIKDTKELLSQKVGFVDLNWPKKDMLFKYKYITVYGLVSVIFVSYV